MAPQCRFDRRGEMGAGAHDPRELGVLEPEGFPKDPTHALDF